MSYLPVEKILLWEKLNEEKKKYIERATKYMEKRRVKNVTTEVEIENETPYGNRVDLQATDDGKIRISIKAFIERPGHWEITGVAVVDPEALKKAAEIMIVATGGGGE